MASRPMAMLRLVTPEPIEVPEEVAEIMLRSQDRDDKVGSMIVRQPVRVNDEWVYTAAAAVRWEAVDDG